MKTIRFGEAASLLLASAMFCLAQSGSAPNPLITRLAGTWTMNEALSKLGNGTPLRFQSTPDGGLEEIRGSAVAPLPEPVHFDGKPYEIDSGNGTIVWTQTGPNQFERQSFSKGHPVSTRRIRISEDGKTPTEETKQSPPDAAPILGTTVYSRSSGAGTGLAGTSAVQSRKTANPPQFTVTAAGPNSLRMVRSNGRTSTTAFDNKPVPVTGPGVILGTTVALRQIDDRSFAETDGRNGTVTGTVTWTLSPDGKVLTGTGKGVGPTATVSVVVYEKQ